MCYHLDSCWTKGTNVTYIHYTIMLLLTYLFMKQSFNFENEQTVLDVKQSLQEKEGIQVDQIRYV
jgi:hypothetical protein